VIGKPRATPAETRSPAPPDQGDDGEDPGGEEGPRKARKSRNRRSGWGKRNRPEIRWFSGVCILFFFRRFRVGRGLGFSVPDRIGKGPPKAPEWARRGIGDRRGGGLETGDRWRAHHVPPLGSTGVIGVFHSGSHGNGCPFEVDRAGRSKRDAGGIEAISRRSSEERATPPEPNETSRASRQGCQMGAARRDGEAPWPGWHPCRDALFSGGWTGGVASLNHRLTALMPPASESAVSESVPSESADCRSIA
jgi:hypothetical protein